MFANLKFGDLHDEIESYDIIIFQHRTTSIQYMTPSFFVGFFHNCKVQRNCTLKNCGFILDTVFSFCLCLNEMIPQQ